jgi:hypothetical protein
MRLMMTAVLAIVASHLFAADPPFAVPQIVLAKIDKDDTGFLMWDEFKRVPVIREIDVPVTVNGETVVHKATLTTTEFTKEKHAVPVKSFKASRGGKTLALEKLAELLAEETPVVFYTGSMAEKYKRLFSADAILIEFAIPAVPVPAPKP